MWLEGLGLTLLLILHGASSAPAVTAVPRPSNLVYIPFDEVRSFVYYDERRVYVLHDDRALDEEE